MPGVYSIQCLCFVAAAPAGPAIPTGPTAVTIKTAAGDYVRNDNTPAAATASSGTGTTNPEKYLFYDPANPASNAPIQPGQPAILKSVQTGQYCRLTACPGAAAAKCMVCDQATAATASSFEYTGSGLSFDHVPMVSAGPGEPLVLGGPVASPSSVKLTFTGGLNVWTPAR